MVGRGACRALQNLDRVAGDAAATAVVLRASESRLISVVRVEVHVRIRR